MTHVYPAKRGYRQAGQPKEAEHVDREPAAEDIVGLLWVDHFTGGVIQTSYREAPAVANNDRFYATVAYLDGLRDPLWRSYALRKADAQRQHTLAIRWFARRRPV